MPVELTLRMSPEDAERFLQALKDGKLTHLGISRVEVASEKPKNLEVPTEHCAQIETNTVESSKQENVPPRT